MLCIVKQVLDCNRYCYFVVLFLECSESRNNSLFLVWHQNRLNWLKTNFISVLFRNFPIEFKWNSGVILYVELLALRDTCEYGWEEQLFLWECY